MKYTTKDFASNNSLQVSQTQISFIYVHTQRVHYWMLKQNIIQIHNNVFSNYNLVRHNCMFEPDFGISDLQPNWKLNLNFAPGCLTSIIVRIDK